jgi:hypothetical protein
METTVAPKMTKQQREQLRLQNVARREELAQARLARRMRGSMHECKVSEILFPVETRQEEMDCNSELSHKIVGIINGKEKLLNQCSPIYQLIPNSEIFLPILQKLDNRKIRYTVTYYHIGNVRFYADIQITDSRYTYKMKGTNDEIYPVLKVQHSYNGKTNYRVIFGYYRVICTNGLTIPVAEMKEFNLCVVSKHTETVKVRIAKFEAMLIRFMDGSEIIKKKVTNKYEMLGGRIVTNVEDRVKEVLKANKISIVDNKKVDTLSYINERLDTETEKLGGNVTDWLIYNAINRYLNDSSVNIAIPEVRMEKDSKVLEYMLENA